MIAERCEMRRVVFLLAVSCAAALLVSSPCRADDAIPKNPTERWWKGNIHTHSLWSDGNDFPEMISDWYRTHGYNFLAISDHNVLQEGIRYIKHSEVIKRKAPDALAKYKARFGGGWVETRGSDAEKNLQIRLKPFGEYRSLVEERGKFLLIPGEEISDSVKGFPVHLNATNIQDLVLPLGGVTVRDAIAANVRSVQDQAQRKGREILVHVNHPNFGLAVTAEDLAHVVAERFFEVYNGHPGIKQLGEGDHPPVERLWDIANTIRIARLKAHPLFGVATDDSHNYHDGSGTARPGRGWTWVKSRYLTPEHIIRAMKAGHCYASSGVFVREVFFDAGQGVLKLDIQPEEGIEYSTQFIGTPVDYNPESQEVVVTDKAGKSRNITRKYSSDVGKVFATVSGTTPSYKLTGDELYVRAVVTSTKPHRDPSYKGQFEQAWTQPVGWEGRVKLVPEELPDTTPTKPESKPATKPEPKPAGKIESKAEPVPEPKKETKPAAGEGKPDAKPDVSKLDAKK